MRRFRSAAGITQEQLGEIVNYTGALVGLVETARRLPSQDFAERCDAALGTDGALSRLWPLVSRGSFPSWFRGFVDLEAAATDISSFQVQVVPGLLQTEDYARAVISAGRLNDVEEKVAARLERQKILAAPSAPQLWVILEENVLRRPIGGQAVLRAQLGHLLDAGRSPQVIIQVLADSAGAHASLDGPMALLSFAEGPNVAYVEGHATGQMITEPHEVRRCSLIFDLIRADALSPQATAVLIATAMEGLST
ncbi:helix-turn-helix transcriptional regulator [Kitasatospora kazusensis]|uniref:Helix-turn-helix transcriptional regulator n=1 Tax=Kitasatospora kazusensis TaxID=407974 RepID=A0ABP5LM02_9ACTN